MFRFESPHYLYFLAAAAILLLLYIILEWLTPRRLNRLGERDLIRELMPLRSAARPRLKTLLALMALVCLILMVARPQMGMRLSEEKREGIEMMVAIDVSNSMLARDVEPSRLQKAKDVVQTVARRSSDDKVGLVVFAGDAFIQMPLTADGVSLGMFLESIHTGMIARQGTDIGEALRLATGGFSTEEAVSRAIVLITDGEDHEGGVETAIKEAAKAGITIYVLGVGSTEGSPIPTAGGWMKDEDGQTVVTALNEAMCQQIAQAGKGAYIHVDGSGSAADALLAELNELQRSRLGVATYSDYSEWFTLFAWIALVLLVADILLLERQNNRLRSLNLFGRKKTLSICLLLLLGTAGASAQSTETILMRKGNQQYRAENYAEAEVCYRKALEGNPNNARVLYNLGNTLLRQGKPKDAMVEYEKAAAAERNPFYLSAIYHNMGVILQSQKQFAPAIECYKESLRQNPADDRTRYNLALCQYQLQQQPPQEDEQNQDQDQQNQDQEQQQPQQQEQQQQPQQEQDDSGMQKDNADRLLKAAEMQERETQDKVRRAMQQRSRRSNTKNW